MLDKIAAFKLKLDMRIRRASRGEIEMFEELHQFVTARRKNVNADVIIEHLTNLRQWFEDYFPPGEDIRQEFNWFRDPFNVDLMAVKLDLPNQERLIDQANDGALKNYFERNGTVKFWSHTHGDYSETSSIAQKVLLPFTTTYLCESGFSAVAYAKNKYRNRLQTDVHRANLRIALSSHRARIGKIIQDKQAHPSH